jgi:hypothetical protein
VCMEVYLCGWGGKEFVWHFLSFQVRNIIYSLCVCQVLKDSFAISLGWLVYIKEFDS